MARKASVTLTHRNSALSSYFGFDWATKLFGEEAIASLPKFVRGKNAGKPKGYVHWRRADSGGYCYDVSGVVSKDQIVDAWIGLGMFSNRSDAMMGNWLGRMQNIAGSSVYLFEEGRARDARQNARYLEELNASYAEEAADRKLANKAG